MSKEVLNYILLVSITLLTASVLTFVIRRVLNVFILKYSKRIKANPTNFSFVKNSIGVLIYTVALIFIFRKIPYLKSVGNALFAGAGIFAAVVGFASQKAFANVVSGVFILIFKPFRVFDTVELSSGKKGVVEYLRNSRL